MFPQISRMYLTKKLIFTGYLVTSIKILIPRNPQVTWCHKS